MATTLYKCLNNGVYSSGNAAYNFGYWGTDWKAGNDTPYVRFWVDLTQLTPGDYYLNQQYVLEMDAQIRYATSLGLGVILTLFKFPPWVNGSQFDPYRVPVDTSTGGPWGTVLYYVMAHWSSLNANANGAYAHVVEICNEPNHTFHAVPGTPLSTSIGRMFVTAQAIQRTGLVTTILAGPATSDAASYSAESFTADLLGYLDQVSFQADALFAWTIHNYVDIRDQNTTHASNVRSALVNRWRGWPFLAASAPGVMITEGGARFTTYGTPGQGLRVAAGYNNLHNDAVGSGAGIYMFSNYLDVTDPDPAFDFGLRNTAYVPRDLYNVWAGLPST